VRLNVCLFVFFFYYSRVVRLILSKGLVVKAPVGGDWRLNKKFLIA
jgi:hypothetical protein